MGTPPGSYSTLDELVAATTGTESSPGFELATLVPAVTFANTNVQPPASTYVTKNDVGQLVVISAVSIASVFLRVRMLMTDGTIKILQYSFSNIPTDRTPATFNFNLPDGFMISAYILPPAGVNLRRGAVYCELFLSTPISTNAGGFVLLAADYLTTGFYPGWPNTPVRSSLDGRGWLRIYDIAAPALGAEIVIAVPVGARWRFVGLEFTLTTSATVATRNVRMMFKSGTDVFYRGSQDPTEPANSGYPYSASFCSFVTPGQVADLHLAVPADLYLMGSTNYSPAMTIETSTANLQAGDQYSASVLAVEEWIDT